jgi:hypothetical protein
VEGTRGGRGGRARGAITAEAVERHDRAHALADRLFARDCVRAGRSFLQLADLGRHRGSELLTPASPWQRLVVKQQQRPSGVALETVGLDLRFDVQYHPHVAEADAEVLKTPGPATGSRQDVVELIAECGGDVTGRGPQRAFPPPAAMVVVEHPPLRDRVAQLDDTRSDRVLLEVVLLAVDALQLARVAVLVAGGDLDLLGESQEAVVEVACDPSSTGVGDTFGELDGVARARVLARGRSDCAGGLGRRLLESSKRLLLLRQETRARGRSAASPPAQGPRRDPRQARSASLAVAGGLPCFPVRVCIRGDAAAVAARVRFGPCEAPSRSSISWPLLMVNGQPLARRARVGWRSSSAMTIAECGKLVAGRWCPHLRR